MILLPGNSKAAQRGPKLTIANLTLHEGGRRKAGADGIAEIALGVEGLVGCALTHPSRAQVYILRWWLRNNKEKKQKFFLLGF